MCTYPHMCSRLPAPALAPTFFAAYRSSYYVVITKSQFVLVLWAGLAHMGFSNPSRFRGHTFCHGGATWAFQNWVPGKLIRFMALELPMHTNVISSFLMRVSSYSLRRWFLHCPVLLLPKFKLSPQWPSFVWWFVWWSRDSVGNPLFS